MTKNEPIERYLNVRMVEMESIPMYAQEQMNECDDPCKGKEYWRTWALDYVRGEYEKALGALIYANVYEKRVDEKQYNFLVKKLFKQWIKSEKDIWKTVC